MLSCRTLVTAFVLLSVSALADVGISFGTFVGTNATAIGALNQRFLANRIANRNLDTARSPETIRMASANMSYTVTRSATQTAQAQYLERLRRSDPVTADLMAREMRAHDFASIYTGIVAPFGLRRADAADAATAYTLLGWMIARGAADPTSGQVHALRTIVASALASDPKFADPATRAALGEEIVISFVTLHAGWQSARREGKLREYSDGVAAMFQKQTGNDLRQLVLTDRGLERRG